MKNCEALQLIIILYAFMPADVAERYNAGAIGQTSQWARRQQLISCATMRQTLGSARLSMISSAIATYRRRTCLKSVVPLIRPFDSAHQHSALFAYDAARRPEKHMNAVGLTTGRLLPPCVGCIWVLCPHHTPLGVSLAPIPPSPCTNSPFTQPSCLVQIF